jgi:hypothetical protein
LFPWWRQDLTDQTSLARRRLYAAILLHTGYWNYMREFVAMNHETKSIQDQELFRECEAHLVRTRFAGDDDSTPELRALLGRLDTECDAAFRAADAMVRDVLSRVPKENSPLKELLDFVLADINGSVDGVKDTSSALECMERMPDYWNPFAWNEEWQNRHPDHGL